MTDEDNKKDETAIVRCGTSVGPIAMEFHREWSPLGYDRAVKLFERGFFDNSHFFRVVPKFLVQFGISYTEDQELTHFAKNPIPDDPKHDPVIPFEEGIISYAGSGDNSRTSQMFISYGSAPSLGTQKWETPLGKVIEGMTELRNLYSYGDGPPFGKGPAQGKIHTGRKYIDENFPKLDHFDTCTVKRSGAEEKQEKNKWKEPRKISEEGHAEAKHHKSNGRNIRFNDEAKVGGMHATNVFAAFGVVMLVILLIFGYRSSQKKGSKFS